MIKKMILMLLVLVGGVMQVNAWGDLYLICAENGSWANGNNGKNDAFKFTCLSENHYRATVPGSYITNGSWYFRFYDSSSDTWKNISPASSEYDADVTSVTVYTNWKNSDKKAFYVTQNANAKYVHIYVTWNNDQWEVSSSTITEQTTYNVAFTNPSGWSTVKGYAFIDGLKLTTNAWPGDALSLSNGVYPMTIVGTDDARVIFNDGSSGDTHQSWTFDVVDNAVYTYSERVGNQTISLSNDFGTFASDYPLTFPTGDANIKAYIATLNGEVIKLSRVTGVVPAKTGLFLARKDATNNSISAVPCATISPVISDNTLAIADNLLKQGPDEEIYTVGSYHRYALVKRDSNYGFAELTSSQTTSIASNRAYLEIVASSSSPAPSLGFTFDENTTAIYSLDADVLPGQNNGQIFDLSGRRVVEPTKGLYIVNGKKVIIK